ncbi:membrane protein [Streptomyces noursei]|uniref:membrane protein n=1 Tax=Streptomyces noursei TaxID=1971 RepID=UPI0005CAB8D1|nr:membrane protein [Streptomyces noursei]
MTHLSLLVGSTPDLSALLAVGAPLTAIALALTSWAIRRRETAVKKRLGDPAVVVAALAAVGCTAYSADTSWRFAADYLDIAGTLERVMLFSAAELGLFATALMARKNLATQGAPGLPGTLVWVITSVQIIPAYAESGPVGGTVRAFVGPIMAALLWHQAMGIELRLRTPGAASTGLIATLGREARQRLLSRLGIAAQARDAAQITRDRATVRAAELATRLANRAPTKRTNRHGRRLTRRLEKAIGRAEVGTNPQQRGELLGQLAARRHAPALATIPLRPPWGTTPQSEGTASLPPQHEHSTTVPNNGPRNETQPIAERGPCSRRGPVPSNCGIAVGADSSTDDRDAGTQPEAGDRGPSASSTGTEPTGDQGPTTPTTGTEPTGDQGHGVPLRRKQTTKPKSKNNRSSRSRGPQRQRPAGAPEQSVEQLVQQVRPYVPSLLERDGNVAVTRVQLREILRREGLKGARNERLTLVLQQLRSEDSSAKARSAR